MAQHRVEIEFTPLDPTGLEAGEPRRATSKPWAKRKRANRK